MFRNFPEKFRSRSPKVRSPGQVKCPHLRKKLSNRHSHSGGEKYLKLSGFGLLPSTCSLFVSDIFYIGDLRSGQLCDLPFISQWGKNSNASNTNTYQICSNRSKPCSIRLLLMTSVQLCICDPWKGHLKSNNDIVRTMYIFAYTELLVGLRIEIETWDRFYNVPLV